MFSMKMNVMNVMNGREEANFSECIFSVLHDEVAMKDDHLQPSHLRPLLLSARRSSPTSLRIRLALLLLIHSFKGHSAEQSEEPTF
uniref:Uncharacterized protein n=1 Tax=Globodera rostochiensis TaxID=31243 RepID=A0A914I664_GLORO